MEKKIQITQARIIEWYQHYDGNVCVSFSGGKDSTVLLHIARMIYPDIPAVFSNTGLEYAEIQRFVRTWDNVDIIAPKMRFDEVISTYGYPIIGKEVAEAIYYARRIRSKVVQVERERESNLISTSCARNRRTVPQGKWVGRDALQTTETVGKQTAWKRKEIGGGADNEAEAERTPWAKSRGSTRWENWRRGCL